MEFKKRRVNGVPPTPRRLLETVEGTVEPVDVRGQLMIDIPWRLVNIYLFIQCSVEKRVIDIQLLTFPVVECHETQHETEGWQRYDWCKRLVEVDSGDLVVSLDDEASFKATDISLGVFLLLEDPQDW